MDIRTFSKNKFKYTLLGMVIGVVFLNLSIFFNFDLFESIMLTSIQIYSLSHTLESHELDELFLIFPFILFCLSIDIFNFFQQYRSTPDTPELKLQVIRELLRSFYLVTNEHMMDVQLIKSNLQRTSADYASLSSIEDSMNGLTGHLKDLFTPESLLEKQIIDEIIQEQNLLFRSSSGQDPGFENTPTQ